MGDGITVLSVDEITPEALAIAKALLAKGADLSQAAKAIGTYWWILDKALWLNLGRRT